ncbi:hypothetical protein Gogos_005522, partial [Gossypium gossypioides]|nr:hypothetical protein [Gossypium gossypioides]
RNPVTLIARSIVGAFVDCFTPPEPDGYKKVGDSGEIRVLSVTETILHTAIVKVAVAPKASRAKSERRGSNRGIYSNSTKEKGPGSMEFTMEEILKATRNFSPAFKIGQGGFGTVYKGRLDDGTFVAIKRAKQSVYDKHLGVEFQSEIRTLAQVEPLHLVKFCGYLEHGDERIVVVEYVPKEPLGNTWMVSSCYRLVVHPFFGVHGKVLDLAARLDIAIDVAHAITYLHTSPNHPQRHKVFQHSPHRKASGKVTDFGFARLAADIDSGATHVSTQVKGTAGYLDPEYLRTYQLTEKSDVYSFGILLVELVTGRRPIEPKREPRERITAKWALKKFNDGDAISALDPRLQQTVGTNLALEKVLELALQCLAPRRQSRPRMWRCGEILWSIRKDYRELSALDLRSRS